MHYSATVSSQILVGLERSELGREVGLGLGLLLRRDPLPLLFCLDLQLPLPLLPPLTSFGSDLCLELFLWFASHLGHLLLEKASVVGKCRFVDPPEQRQGWRSLARRLPWRVQHLVVTELFKLIIIIIKFCR
jgi:hypothetical protein